MVYIVAFSGAHTLGSCQQIRSGFTGSWTTDPYRWDNECYTNLLNPGMEREGLGWAPSVRRPILYAHYASGGHGAHTGRNFFPSVREYAADGRKFNHDFVFCLF